MEDSLRRVIIEARPCFRRRPKTASLTDGALVDPRRIEAIVTRVANVRGAHSIRTRGTPGAIFVDLRVELPGELSISEVHGILSVIEDELRARFDSIITAALRTLSPSDRGAK